MRSSSVYEGWIFQLVFYPFRLADLSITVNMILMIIWLRRLTSVVANTVELYDTDLIADIMMNMYPGYCYRYRPCAKRTLKYS